MNEFSSIPMKFKPNVSWIIPEILQNTHQKCYLFNNKINYHQFKISKTRGKFLKNAQIHQTNPIHFYI